MTLNEMITNCMELKPSQFDFSQYVRWTSNLEKRIFNEVFSTHADPPATSFDGYTEDSGTTELLLPDEFCDVYKYYLYSMVDFENMETDKYVNTSAMFNGAYQEFAQYWHRTHKPQPTVLKVW